VAAWRWATSSEAFATGDPLHRAGARAGGISCSGQAQPGGNLFTDLGRDRALQADPWVAPATLARRLPGEVLATIVEHRPAALVQLGGLYVLDEEGRLFKRAAPEDGLDLPVVTGLSREAWAERKPELQLRLFGALHLLDLAGVGLPRGLDQVGSETAGSRSSPTTGPPCRRCAW
jgi:hypothetical protein